MSERDGWAHLYLYDGVTGKVKNQITRGKRVVRNVDKVDEDRRQIWFHRTGLIETGVENFTDFLPSELADIEKLVRELGVVQKTPPVPKNP
jgi:hypothetical protein